MSWACVATLADQDGGPQGFFLPFLGRVASVQAGLFRLLARKGIPMVTGFSIREGDKWRAEIQEPEFPHPSDDPETEARRHGHGRRPTPGDADDGGDDDGSHAASATRASSRSRATTRIWTSTRSWRRPGGARCWSRSTSSPTRKTSAPSCAHQSRSARAE